MNEPLPYIKTICKPFSNKPNDQHKCNTSLQTHSTNTKGAFIGIELLKHIKVNQFEHTFRSISHQYSFHSFNQIYRASQTTGYLLNALILSFGSTFIKFFLWGCYLCK